MPDVEVHEHRSDGGATWLIALLVIIVLAVVLWLTVLRPRGGETTDINVELNVPDAAPSTGDQGGRGR
jgi:hypothetical protein